MDIRISRKQNIDAIQYDLLDHSILLPRLKPHQVFPVKNVIITRETADDYCVMSGNDIEKSCIPVILLGVEKDKLEQILKQPVNIVYV